MKSSMQYEVKLSEEELKILRDILENEYFQLSGSVNISPVKKIQNELKIIGNLKTHIDAVQPA